MDKISIDYSIGKGRDSYGSFVKATPPHLVNGALQGFHEHTSRIMKMYTDDLDLAIVGNLTDEQLASLINTAQLEQQRRIDELQTD